MGRKAHLGDEEMMLYVYGGGGEPLGTPLCRTYGRLGMISMELSRLGLWFQGQAMGSGLRADAARPNKAVASVKF